MGACELAAAFFGQLCFLTLYLAMRRERFSRLEAVGLALLLAGIALLNM